MGKISKDFAKAGIQEQNIETNKIQLHQGNIKIDQHSTYLSTNNVCL